MAMKVTLRSDSVHISGYVNAVERLSRPIRDADGKTFLEKIAPGTFDRAIREANDIGVMLNHDRLLTTVKKGNITLREDSVGLYFDGDIFDPEVVKSAKRRELVGWSFGFIPTGETDEESDKDGIDFVRTVSKMVLKEVSIINRQKTPCYPATSIMTRCDETGETTVHIRAQTDCEYSDEERKQHELDLRKRRLKIKKSI